MKKIILSSTLILGLFVGCSEVQTLKQEGETVSIEESTPKKFTANDEELIAIEGMTCMINCVSAVKKALKNTAGITDVKVDFDPDRAVDVATVKFDNKELDRAQIISVIEGINGGLYHVVDSVEVRTKDSIGEPIGTEVISQKKDLLKTLKNKVSTKIEIPSIIQLMQVIL